MNDPYQEHADKELLEEHAAHPERFHCVEATTGELIKCSVCGRSVHQLEQDNWMSRLNVDGGRLAQWRCQAHMTTGAPVGVDPAKPGPDCTAHAIGSVERFLTGPAPIRHIVVKDRDDLLRKLCERVLGATPEYMDPSMDDPLGVTVTRTVGGVSESYPIRTVLDMLEHELANARAALDTERELRASVEQDIRNLAHYAEGLPGHVSINSGAIPLRDAFLRLHSECASLKILQGAPDFGRLRGLSTKWRNIATSEYHRNHVCGAGFNFVHEFAAEVEVWLNSHDPITRVPINKTPDTPS